MSGSKRSSALSDSAVVDSKTDVNISTKWSDGTDAAIPFDFSIMGYSLDVLVLHKPRRNFNLIRYLSLIFNNDIYLIKLEVSAIKVPKVCSVSGAKY